MALGSPLFRITGTVDTERLFLRQFEVEDITPQYVSALADWQVVSLTEARHVEWTHSEVASYVRNTNSAPACQLVGVFLRCNARHIGNIRLSGYSVHHNRVDVGLMIFDKRSWNEGYAPEALSALCTYLFENHDIHRICADYYSVNKASAAVFRKCGFTVEGIFRDHFYLKGRYVDSVRVALCNENNERTIGL